MIVKNEERFLEDALRSVAGVVDEICIVDTGSTDRTIEIARAHGARVIEATWQDDFALARNAALGLATRRWILVLDADERLEHDSRAALMAISRTQPNGRGKWITCRNLTDDYRGSGVMTNAIVRIFPNDTRIRYRNAIHEFVALDGNAGGVPADMTGIAIVHHGYLNAVVSERLKPERNMRLSRLAAQRDPDDPFHQYNLGMAALLTEDRDGAITALERMLELTRRTPRRGYRVHGLVILAELYAEQRGDVAAALVLLRECLQLIPNYSNAHFAHGKCLARGGDLYAARDAFGRAIAAGAHDAEQFVVDNEIAIWKAHSEIGATLMHERRFAAALAWFELAARARPAVQALTLNRAKCHEALGDLDAARALLRSSFGRDRDEASALEWINFLLRRERIEEACAAVDTALAYVGEETHALLLGTAAAAHLRRGQRERAAAAVERALLRYDGPAARMTLVAVAAALQLPELHELIGQTPASRAKPLRIAYHTVT
jgi:tetratricopeptide (TPR) repeat protein